MAEVEIRDPTIKLFGKTIVTSDYFSHCQSIVLEDRGKETSYEELGNEIADQTTSGVSENPSVDREASKNEERSETSNSPDDKSSKKPDKILPCPRCNSMDTKFCYFNNYNVHQPRHFCKNCQRYWTAGGTMRNVPVGAGRRKNKTSSSSSSSSAHFRQLIIPDGHQFLGNNGAFLTFGSDSSISDDPNGNRDDHSSKSSITASNSSEKGAKIPSHQSVVKNVLPFPPQLHQFTGLPWPPYMAPPPFIPPGFPVSYYPPPPPPPYWGCTPSPTSWTLISNPNPQNPSVLGKRLRDGKIVRQSNCAEEEGLKVGGSNEAARSSIWSARSINGNGSGNGGGIFGSFQQSAKGKGDDNEIESWSLLQQANPAAFSRALKFREIA